MASLQERLERARQEQGADVSSLQKRLERARQEKASPSLYQRGVNMAGDAASAVGDAARYSYDWATGNVPKEDLPELSEATLPAIARLHGVSPGGEGATKQDIDRSFKIGMGYLASSDPQQVADIAKDTLPGATTRKDDQGNLIVQYDGKEYYVNRPGASTSDVMQITGELMSYMPAARAASLAKGLTRRLATAFTGEAATSAARDTAASALGSEQGVNLGRAMMAGIGGAGGEAIAPLAARALPRILRNPKYVDKQGNLTKAGKRAARTAGFDPEQMDKTLRQEFNRVARDAPTGTPEEMTAYGRMAQGRRFGIDLTPGQAYRDSNLLAREYDMLRQSDDAGGVARAARDRQDAAVARARRDLQGRMSQPDAPRGQAEPQIPDRRAAGEAVEARASMLAERQMDEVSRAYDETDRYTATFDPENLPQMKQNVRSALETAGVPADDLSPENTPAARQMLRIVDEEIDKMASGSKDASIKRLEAVRQRLNRQIEGAKRGPDKRAAVTIKSAFDDQLDDMVRNELFTGDPRALTKLKEARSLRRQYSEQFGDLNSKDRVDRIIGEISQANPEPEQVVNYTIGWSEIGNPKDSRRILSRLRDTLGRDSAEWDAMREAGLETLFRTSVRQDVGTPKQMQSAVKRALEKKRSVLKELYSDDEIKTLESFVDSAMFTRALPDELSNPSGSANKIMDALKRGLSYGQSSARISGNFTSGFLFSQMRRMLPNKTVKEAQELFRPMDIPRPRAPIVGAAGASAGASQDEELRGFLGEGVDIGKRGVRRGYNLLAE
jgi:hypothetical protein